MTQDFLMMSWQPGWLTLEQTNYSLNKHLLGIDHLPHTMLSPGESTWDQNSPGFCPARYEIILTDRELKCSYLSLPKDVSLWQDPSHFWRRLVALENLPDQTKFLLLPYEANQLREPRETSSTFDERIGANWSSPVHSRVFPPLFYYWEWTQSMSLTPTFQWISVIKMY